MAVINIDCSMSKFANISFRIRTRITKIFGKTNLDDYQIPIILNNYNKLEHLVQMVDYLVGAGHTNIYIIDNNSNYPPLLDYYLKTKHTVFKLNKNVGFLALWRTIIYTRFSNSYYVYSDADILPTRECPTDFISYFKQLLSQYTEVEKVGFGLKIDDIPEHYPLKANVINWEKQFWEYEIDTGVFQAPIDTTFALYRPGIKGGSELKALRTGYPYLAHHLPWYIDTNNLSEEEVNYQRTASTSSSWTNKLVGRSTIPKY
jgi:hypothetical protein